jgi:hypothetical protein
LKAEFLPFAESIGSRISVDYISNSGYFPKQPWGCESQIYPSLTGIALLKLYRITKNSLYLQGVISIIESNLKKQRSSGGWPLYLGVNANGVKFHVSDDIIKVTSRVEDLPSTVTALRLISEYQQTTQDDSYSKFIKKGFDYLKEFWNEKSGVFNEMISGDVLKLRASPRDYQIYAYQCVDSLQTIYPDAKAYVAPVYQSVKQIFEAMNGATYPLLYGMHAAIIAEKEGASSYTTSVVKERIIQEIALKSRFLIPDQPGALGHHDGLRGICLTEGHLRNSVGVAMAMDFYDKATQTNFFSSTALHADLEKWIQSMYHDGKYFEYIDFKTGLKSGDGSAGYYLPLFWILESF